MLIDGVSVYSSKITIVIGILFVVLSTRVIVTISPLLKEKSNKRPFFSFSFLYLDQ